MGECVSDVDKTIILVGSSGNGKSATANSIIEADVFGKIASSNSVTTSLATILDNGQILTVIDTSGPFDISSIEPETLGIHAVVVVFSLRNRYSEEEYVVIESLRQFFGAKLMDYMIVVFTHGDALEDMTLDYYLAHMCPEQMAKILEVCGDRFVMFDNVTEDKIKKYQQREELLRLVDEVVTNNGGVPYTDKLFVEHKEGEWELIDEHSEDESSENGSEFNKVFEDCLLFKLDELMHQEMSQLKESVHQEMSLRMEKLWEDESSYESSDESSYESSDNGSELFDKAHQLKIESKLLETTLRLENQLAEKFAQMQTEYTAQEAQSKLNDEQKIESKLRETTLNLENQLADNFAQIKAEFKAQEALRKKSNDEMRKLREDMERAKRHTEEMFKKIQLKMDEEMFKKIQLKMDEERQVKFTYSDFEKISPHKHEQETLREKIRELKLALADEQVARTLAEAKTVQVQKKLNDEISKLRGDLGRAQRDGEKPRKSRLTDSSSNIEGVSKKVDNTPSRTNPFGVFNTNTTSSACLYNFQSPQPLQPTSANFFCGFSRDEAGFDQPAQIGGGQQARGSVFSSFGQSRQVSGAAGLETW